MWRDILRSDSVARDEIHTVTIGVRRGAETYEIELLHDNPSSQAVNEPRHGQTAFDLEVLSTLQRQPDEYGEALAEQLFSDPEIAEGFVVAEAAAQGSGSFLRVQVRIDRSAPDLQALRWELLRHPRSGVALSTSERVVLCRFMSSGDHTPVTAPARAGLTALVAVSAPTPESLQRWRLASVDYEGEVHRVREALDGVEIRTLGGPDSPLTLERLGDALRHEVDVVYLVCHGMIGNRGTPALVLQDEAGAAEVVEGQALATRVRELRVRPRLVVLASCQSAGDGEHGWAPSHSTAQVTTASLLAEAGVPAVIGMQGFISMTTVELMMPTLFSELLRHGELDRALAVARGRVRDRHDWWMPVLFTRLKSGVLWSMPSTEGDPAPPPDPLAARLEDLYALLAERTIAGEDTTAIEQEILELRRRKRHGPTLHPGEHLGQGRFRLVEVIGQGGFAVVWKAYDNKERRLVAVKVLHGELARVESRRERLFRGAKRMAELQHPNVVRVLLPEGEEQGFYYFVMELITGGDLHRAIIDGTLDTDRALAVIDAIADVLATAHTSGLVHRDVKPENILLRDDGAPALGDFDLVQARDTTGGTRTAAMGTVVYAAPEQSEDASRVDHRADVYSLGMTAVFCVYGKKLSLTTMFRRDAFLRGLPCTEAIREVLRQAVALEPKDRFESMEVFRRALAAARGGGQPERTHVEVVEPRREPPRLGARIVAPTGGVELVWIPGGRFLMGSSVTEEGRYAWEGPQHEVELDGFWLGKTPVTNAQYGKYMRAKGRVKKPEFWSASSFNHPQQPVVGVSWEEAQSYCEWAELSLPTEAQWEYACRAGTTTRYHSGNGEEDLARVGWHGGNSGGRLHAVGELEPNGFGLYDMHGNIYEWCQDTWVGSYEGTVHQPGDGLRTQPGGDLVRVVRGGHFDYEPRDARSAYRIRLGPDSRFVYVGFRVAKRHS